MITQSNGRNGALRRPRPGCISGPAFRSAVSNSSLALVRSAAPSARGRRSAAALPDLRSYAVSEFWKLWLTAKRLGVTLLFALTFSSWAQTPLPRAHSHNDYEQPRPLQDALAQGFGSVEADIWLVNGELLVAHDLKDAKPDRTLETLYLDPLRERARTNGGRIYPGGGEFTLLVDIKSEADPTYAALRPRLIKYRDLLTRFTDSNVTPAAVTVILSGARPIAEVRAEPERWCAIDGRLADLESNPSRFLFCCL